MMVAIATRIYTTPIPMMTANITVINGNSIDLISSYILYDIFPLIEWNILILDAGCRIQNPESFLRWKFSQNFSNPDVDVFRYFIRIINVFKNACSHSAPGQFFLFPMDNINHKGTFLIIANCCGSTIRSPVGIIPPAIMPADIKTECRAPSHGITVFTAEPTNPEANPATSINGGTGIPAPRLRCDCAHTVIALRATLICSSTYNRHSSNSSCLA